jgi:hypothetical protein
MFASKKENEFSMRGRRSCSWKNAIFTFSGCASRDEMRKKREAKRWNEGIE